MLSLAINLTLSSRLADWLVLVSAHSLSNAFQSYFSQLHREDISFHLNLFVHCGNSRFRTYDLRSQLLPCSTTELYSPLLPLEEESNPHSSVLPTFSGSPVYYRCTIQSEKSGFRRFYPYFTKLLKNASKTPILFY